MDSALGSYCGTVASTLRSILLLGNIWITICTCISLRHKCHSSQGSKRKGIKVSFPFHLALRQRAWTCTGIVAIKVLMEADGKVPRRARDSRPYGSFPSVALNLAMVCVLTIKSRCKCRRSSRKPDGCKCGYHVNQKDNAFPSTSVCDKKFSSKHGSSSSYWHWRVGLNWSFQWYWAWQPSLFLLSGCLTFTPHLSHSHTSWDV